jgi:hypothetical protein
MTQQPVKYLKVEVAICLMNQEAGDYILKNLSLAKSSKSFEISKMDNLLGSILSEKFN